MPNNTDVKAEMKDGIGLIGELGMEEEAEDDEGGSDELTWQLLTPTIPSYAPSSTFSGSTKKQCVDFSELASKARSRVEVVVKENGENNEEETEEDKREETTERVEETPSWVMACQGESGCPVKIRFICLWMGCSAHLESSASLTSHLHQHIESAFPPSNTPLFCCAVLSCDKAFMNVEEMRSHMSLHVFHADIQRRGLDAVLQREECDGIAHCGFPKRMTFLYSEERAFCFWEDCQSYFTNLCEFFTHCSEHVDQADRNEENTFSCFWNHCNCQFLKRNHLKTHMRSHSGEKYSACPFCGQVFANTTKLIDHVVRRSKPGSLVCELCRKSFPDTRRLRLHCHRHLMRERCHVCNKLVTSKSDLTRHILKVHGSGSLLSSSSTVRPRRKHGCDGGQETKGAGSFPCQQCSLVFRWQKQLKRHLLTHLGRDPPKKYVCDGCSAKYEHGSSLARHLRSVHKMAVPTGFSSFRFKKCADGLFRLQCRHPLSPELSASLSSQTRPPHPPEYSPCPSQSSSLHHYDGYGYDEHFL